MVSTATGGSPQPCISGNLTASLAVGDGAGAGSVFPYLVLTNKGTGACTLFGFPGVSFVGGGTGSQLGAAALRVDDSSRQTVTVQPGQSSHARLWITRAANYPTSTCSPQQADGLRVYPPDQTQALFVQTSDYTACANSAVKLISVGPMVPGAQ